MNIQLDKKYTTRDGRKVRVHAIDGPYKGFPVIASIKNENEWVICRYPEDGTNCLYRNAELIEIEPPYEFKTLESKGVSRMGDSFSVTHEENHPLFPGVTVLTLTEFK